MKSQLSIVENQQQVYVAPEPLPLDSRNKISSGSLNMPGMVTPVKH